ncbi:MAG: hypothetical protein MZW92_13875 [Comamonadaceae bacterium]|nr:hypothetical protein [Comamonadaceae bacterium]
MRAPTLKLTSAPGGMRGRVPRAPGAWPCARSATPPSTPCAGKYAVEARHARGARARRAAQKLVAREGAGEPADDVVRAQRSAAACSVRCSAAAAAARSARRRPPRGAWAASARSGPTSRTPKPTSTALQQQHAALEAELADEIAAARIEVRRRDDRRGAVGRSRPASPTSR